MKQRGFTLAEVLIVLGIIGIVAAMTIPTIVQRAQERATVSQLKKVYSTLSSAYELAIKDNGNPADNWATSDDSVATVLMDYLKVSKNCIKESCDNYTFYRLDNSSTLQDFQPRMILSDGTLILFHFENASCAE